MERLGLELTHLSIVLGVFVEVFAIALIPVVVMRRREPSSTAAWILALVFLPVIGATLFLLFGRDRVRIPAQWKRDADRAFATRRAAAGVPVPPSASDMSSRATADAAAVVDAREEVLARVTSPLDRELFRVGATLAGTAPTVGNEVLLLVDGDATYAAIGAAIDRARRSVHAEYYLVRRGATADWLRERLMAAARRGVSVKLLLDGYGSFWIGRGWARPLREAGALVAFFLPARLLFFQPMNLRNHRKIVVVDGEEGFTGGLNIGDEYRGASGPWRDTHLRIRGPAVARLSEVFAQDWHFATRLPVEGGEGRLSGEALSREGGALVSIVRSGPDAQGMEREAIHRTFFSAITLARSRVLITTPYFIPDRAIVVALQTAALRGIAVRLLFPSRSNHKFVFQAGRSFYEELLEAGVEIYEYGPGMIHAKTMVVDGTVALVGSANMDLRSFRLNFEVHAVVRDESTAASLEGCFEKDLAVSRRIELSEFRRRSWALRVVEGAARLLSPLM